MQEVASLADNKDPGVGPLHGMEPDMSALPMMPRDMHISAALHRYGSWAYTQVTPFKKPHANLPVPLCCMRCFPLVVLSRGLMYCARAMLLPSSSITHAARF